jgi:hypothetical protein
MRNQSTNSLWLINSQDTTGTLDIPKDLRAASTDSLQ